MLSSVGDQSALYGALDLLITLAAALIASRDGKLLLVRKRNTPFFMQAGGKIEPSEAPINALIRELKEELELIITPAQALYLGRFYAPAANEPGWTVEAELFMLHVDKDVAPAAEIAEILWVDPSGPIDVPLAPLTNDIVIPLYLRGYA